MCEWRKETVRVFDVKMSFNRDTFRGFCLVAASCARMHRKDGNGHQHTYIFTEPGKKPYLYIDALNYGKTTDILINNKYYMTVTHRR